MVTWDFFVQASIHTPLWMYAILFYLLYVGAMLIHTRVVHLVRLLIIPLLLLGLSLHNLSIALHFTVYTIIAWFIATTLGVAIGFVRIQFSEVWVDRSHWLIKAPGTWSVIIIICVVFFTKYFFSYELDFDPRHLHNSTFELIALIVAGLCSGFSLGRFFGFCYRLWHDPSCDLSHQHGKKGENHVHSKQ